jgi:hypothetical protein
MRVDVPILAHHHTRLIRTTELAQVFDDCFDVLLLHITAPKQLAIMLAQVPKLKIKRV